MVTATGWGPKRGAGGGELAGIENAGRAELEVRRDRAEKGDDDGAFAPGHFGKIGFHVERAAAGEIHAAGREAGGEFEDLSRAESGEDAGNGFEAGLEKRGVGAHGVRRLIGKGGLAPEIIQHLAGEGNIGIFAAGDDREKSGGGNTAEVVFRHTPSIAMGKKDYLKSMTSLPAWPS